MPPLDAVAGVEPAALRHGAEALGLSLSPEDGEQLLAYLALLQRWNATYNLTAVRDPHAMLTQHLLDCLAVVSPLRRYLGSHATARSLLDVGSGGGLPGVVLAILFPGLTVTCVDTVGKKAAFIRQAAGELKLKNLSAVHARVEQLREKFDVVTSRAFSTLLDFTRLTHQQLASEGVWMAMKGRVPHDEMSALPEQVTVFHVEHLIVPGLDAERCLVWMRPHG